MTHGEAWLVAGRDFMWFCFAVAPVGMLSSDDRGLHPLGFILYAVVMYLCYCAGAGYI